MELKDRLKKIMAEQFGIKTDEELIKACENMEPVDLGIFVIPIEGKENEEKSKTYCEDSCG